MMSRGNSGLLREAKKGDFRSPTIGIKETSAEVVLKSSLYLNKLSVFIGFSESGILKAGD
jgi:hypothetical protein